jgi:hypothetical protein
MRVALGVYWAARSPRNTHQQDTPSDSPANQTNHPPKRLEFKLTHESISAAEEKRTRTEKERLERVERPAAARSAALSAKLDAVKAESGALRGQIAEVDKQVGLVYDTSFVHVCGVCVCGCVGGLLMQTSNRR